MSFLLYIIYNKVSIDPISLERQCKGMVKLPNLQKKFMKRLVISQKQTIFAPAFEKQSLLRCQHRGKTRKGA